MSGKRCLVKKCVFLIFLENLFVRKTGQTATDRAENEAEKRREDRSSPQWPPGRPRSLKTCRKKTFQQKRPPPTPSPDFPWGKWGEDRSGPQWPPERPRRRKRARKSTKSFPEKSKKKQIFTRHLLPDIPADLRGAGRRSGSVDGARTCRCAT